VTSAKLQDFYVTSRSTPARLGASINCEQQSAARVPNEDIRNFALDPHNIHILCQDCNIGKSNKDLTDWLQLSFSLPPFA
jgi:hypothetical protein